VLRAAAGLLADGGRDAVSTRAVSAAAGVQAPTLYRLFGDKEGLLDAVAAYGFEEYLAGKHSLGQSDDPVADLRRGWDLHMDFGLSRSAFYVLMYGGARTGEQSAAGRETADILHAMITRVAAAGRLRLSVERATQLVHSTSVGITLTLIATPPEQRDPGLSVLARETVLRAITTDTSPAETGADSDITTRAVALRVALQAAPPEQLTTLTDAERTLLAEWLNRLTDAAGPA
jgi:AcrR family transcriptional regulator